MLKEAGVAKGARDLYELETGKSAISKENTLNYEYIDEQIKELKNIEDGDKNG